MPKEGWSFNNMNGHTSGLRRARSERGQAFLLIVVVVAMLLLGVLGLGTDYGQVWAHRQMAQGAADAACQAAAADLFLNAVDPEAESTYGIDFSWIGSSFTCGSKPNSVPCKYASLNGYSGSHVSVSFPTSLPGVPPVASGFGAIAHPYVQVSITYPVTLFFTKLVSSNSTFNMSAKASCGLNPVELPIPLLVLHHTASGALSVGGAASINILGGPNRSIQVNSNSTTAVSVGAVNLSNAGPSGTGADFAVFGGPTTKPAGVNVGTTGHWVVPASPVGDPWVIIAAPSVPSTAGAATPVPFTVNGCPDPVGCVEFTGGNYTGCISNNVAPGGNGCLISPRFTSGGNAWQAAHAYATGALIQPTNAQHNAGGYIYQAQNAGNSGTPNPPNPWNQTIGGNQADGSVTWKNMGPASTSPNTAIFDPGVYYVGAGGLQPGSNTTMRMSTAAGDGRNGVTFYFSTSAGTLSVGSNTGKASACTSASPGSGSPNNCVVSYKPSGAAVLGVTSRALQCPNGPANPSQLPATIDGNILFGPCSGTYGSADGKNRGFLFFQNRSAAANPSWGGGGQFLLSGFMYFHSGTGATCGTNTTCLTMNGGSGAGAFALGNVVVDKLSMTGNSTLNMILNPAVTFQVLRPQLLR
jgi:hypothetical protein